MARVAFQTAMRAAAVTLLTDFKADTGLTLQIYPARPRSIAPPTAFVDVIRESLPTDGSMLVRRQVSADVVVIHGIFDSMEAANQKDAFADAFIDWVLDNIHAAGANTTIAVSATEDLPDYVPEWIPPAVQKTYYATRIELEGLALSG